MQKWVKVFEINDVQVLCTRILNEEGQEAISVKLPTDLFFYDNLTAFKSAEDANKVFDDDEALLKCAQHEYDMAQKLNQQLSGNKDE